MTARPGGRPAVERRRARLASTDRDREATRRLAALRDVQHGHDGDAVGTATIAATRPAPWHKRPDLVTQALVLLERDGMVLDAAGSTRAWRITAAERLMLPPGPGPARQRRPVGGLRRAR